mmetsp:Transcript_41228/g.49990  ORF Transcript_41228/g.49990 Transcript_41228/m.49990 type:complete len:82 (+) Transcript_41228:347-592(+)
MPSPTHLAKGQHSGLVTLPTKHNRHDDNQMTKKTRAPHLTHSSHSMNVVDMWSRKLLSLSGSPRNSICRGDSTITIATINQ